MKKNGFTLIELLAVLVILALIALVTISAVSGTLKNYKKNLYENQIDNIESAARVWGSDNMLLLPNSAIEATCEYSNVNNCPSDYNQLIIKLSDLQKGGYIGNDITNPRTKEKFEDLEIVIRKNGKKLEYEVIDQTYFVYKVGDEISVELNNNDTMDFYVIEESTDKTKYVTAILTEPLSTDTIAWCSGCTTNTNGPTTINESINLLGWNNTIEKRLITIDEFNNVKETIKNDVDQSWISGNYWTGTTYGDTSAYYVNASSELIEDEIINSHQLRPVIKISKTYVKLK